VYDKRSQWAITVRFTSCEQKTSLAQPVRLRDAK